MIFEGALESKSHISVDANLCTDLVSKGSAVTSEICVKTEKEVASEHHYAANKRADWVPKFFSHLICSEDEVQIRWIVQDTK